MKVIVVVDEKNGMMFNGRRQSRDRHLREMILRIAKDGRLCMNAYSAGQFDSEEGLVVSETFLGEAGSSDYCFVENEALRSYEDKISELFVFKWNREYPGDKFLDIDLDSEEWTLAQTEEFAGYSHERITLERYIHE